MKLNSKISVSDIDLTCVLSLNLREITWGSSKRFVIVTFTGIVLFTNVVLLTSNTTLNGLE